MPAVHDDEFGNITVRTHARTQHIRISVAPNGSLRASIPTHATQKHLRSMIDSSRTQIRELIAKTVPDTVYVNGMRIGKSHSLIVLQGTDFSVRKRDLKLFVTLPPEVKIDQQSVQQAIRSEVTKLLRKEASHYLPRRLKVLAEKLNCTYERVRLSHASTRWGSCSSSGTISLNIALMKLPFDLIDYVIIHELCHTRQMNHSPQFWRLVESADPDYTAHRRSLKQHTPTI